VATGTPLCPPIDRGSGYCGNSERHECELQLEVEDIHHRAPKPKVRKPKAFVSASHKNVLNEFNGVTLLPPLSKKRSEFIILRTTD